MSRGEVRTLQRLARAHGVQIAFQDVLGRRQEASPESLRGVLRALGVDVGKGGGAEELLRERRQERWRQPLEPVLLAWEGRFGEFEIRLPEPAFGRPLRARVVGESGWRRGVPLKRTRIRGQARIDGERFVSVSVEADLDLPLGYHGLELETGSSRFTSHLIAAPVRLFRRLESSGSWGLFAPLYALHGEKSWGSGDLSTLEQFMGWAASWGARMVGTLPLLPCFLEEPFEPSPYSPVSRLFWNEFYVDPGAVPELSGCRGARKLMESSWWQRQLAALRGAALVDYREGMVLKRRVLSELAGYFFARSGARREQLEEFLRRKPEVESYARFRAVLERRGEVWPRWPEGLRNGRVGQHDYARETERYYLYAQWIAEEQMRSAALSGKRLGISFYLDLPLGVHRDGYDVWRNQRLFALGASGGAPPDAVFTKGQNWGFPPLHPERMREDGYAYLIAYLRHHFQHANLLRIDHVMALHRLYWVPEGSSGVEGAYVRHPSEEWYAVLSLESHRHQGVLIGENLGTVPPEVNTSMNRHGARQLFVVQYEIRPSSRNALRPVPAGAVASMNTHDMPPFNAFFRGLDIADRQELGLLSRAQARQERIQRAKFNLALTRFLRRRGWLGKGRAGAGELLRACLAYLGASRADWVLVNLEDLWLETESQNVPGTNQERVNWRRKTRHRLEELNELPTVRACLEPMRLSAAWPQAGE